MLVKVSTPPEGVVDGGGVEIDAADIGYAMLPLEPELSKTSSLLPALRTQTATRYAELPALGVHVHRLLVAHCCVRIQFAPS